MENNEDSIVLQNNEFIDKKIDPEPMPQENIGVDNSLIDDFAEGQASSIDMAEINKFTQISVRRDQLYTLIDEMLNDPTIAAILETYAEDATEYNDKGQIIWVTSDDAQINAYISFLLNAMQVDKYAYNWVWNICAYGDLYLQLFKKSEYDLDPIFNKNQVLKKRALKEDVKINVYSKNDKYVHYIEAVPNPAEMFELTRLGKTSGFIKADINTNLMVQNNMDIASGLTFFNQYKFKQNDVNIYGSDKFVHAALEENNSRINEEVEIFLDKDNEQLAGKKSIVYKVRKGKSLLYNVFKIWRELSLLENSMLLNRITKSAILRVINVEVGDMPKDSVGPHLQGIKQMMEQKSAINEGKSIQEYTNPGPIENNIYVPTRNGKGTITADQIGGDVNVGQLPDVDYFENKFFGAMRVPKQYFGLTDDGAGFNGGQSLAIISSRYAKMIKRIQNTLLQALTTAINLMLIDKGLKSYINKFKLHMQPPTTQEEIDRRDNLASKVQIISDIMNLVNMDEVENITKIKILKSLISEVITDSEVITLIEAEIKKLEEQQDKGIDNNSSNPEAKEEKVSVSTSFENEPLNLDSELGLDFEEPERSQESGEEETLPNPEELNVDLTAEQDFM